MTYRFERTQPHWTYVARAAGGTALYVGCTRDPLGRMCAHRGNGEWFQRAVSIEWRRWPNYEIARAAERTLIREHQPLHNRNMMQPRYNRRADRSVSDAAILGRVAS